MNFSFLSNLSEIELPADIDKINKSNTVRTANRIPGDSVHLRVNKKGLVTPSLKFADEAQLEYRNVNDPNQGFGLDLIPSDQWPQYNYLIDSYKSMNPDFVPQYPLFVMCTPKKTNGAKTKKLDLFSACKYNEDGSPKSSIFTQPGLNEQILEDVLRLIFNEDLEPTNYFDEVLHEHLPMEEKVEAKNTAYFAAKGALISELVDKHFEEGGKLDLLIDFNSPFEINTPVLHIPKKVSRGAKKGQLTTVDRSKVVVYPLILANPIEETREEELVEEEKATEEASFNPVVMGNENSNTVSFDSLVSNDVTVVEPVNYAEGASIAPGTTTPEVRLEVINSNEGEISSTPITPEEVTPTNNPFGNNVVNPFQQ